RSPRRLGAAWVRCRTTSDGSRECGAGTAAPSRIAPAMPKMPLPPAESMQLDSLAEVARGGMGSVELARVVDGPQSGQILAVKRLHSNIAEDPEFVSMFL